VSKPLEQNVNQGVFGCETSQDDPNSFKHWNIFFKDIYRVSIDIVDRDTHKLITQHDLEQLLGAESLGARHSQTVAANSPDGMVGGAETSERHLKIYFVLKIHYQVNEQDEEDVEGSAASTFAEKGRRSVQAMTKREDAGLMGRLAGLKVGRKQIVTKDWKVMRRVYSAIQAKISKFGQ